jgi:hypothetical protein
VRRRCGSHTGSQGIARGTALLGLGVWVCAALGAPAGALSWADGRLELHGYYELQVRAIARDFDASDDWDVTQLAHVLDLELELDLLPAARRSSTPLRSSRASRSATTACGPTPAGCSRA